MNGTLHLLYPQRSTAYGRFFITPDCCLAQVNHLLLLLNPQIEFSLMPSSVFILESGFDLTVDDIQNQLLEEGWQSVEVEIPIDGQLFFTERNDLIHQYLHTALIGEELAKVSSSIECEFGPIDSAHSVTFSLVPTDLVAFAEALFQVAIPFMDEELAEEHGYDEISQMEAQDGWHLLDEPDAQIQKLRFPALVMQAKVLQEDNDEAEDDG